MNSMGSNVNYEQMLADIERTDFGFGDLQKYKLFLEATLNQLKEERIKGQYNDFKKPHPKTKLNAKGFYMVALSKSLLHFCNR